MGKAKRHDAMILLDVNIFIDVLEDRAGLEASSKIIELVKENKLPGCISALTVPILWFLIEKRMSESEAKTKTKAIIKGFKIIPLTSRIINVSFDSEMADFEDAIQFNSTIKGEAEFLITRNKRDFMLNDRIVILTPEEFLARHGH